MGLQIRSAPEKREKRIGLGYLLELEALILGHSYR